MLGGGIWDAGGMDCCFGGTVMIGLVLLIAGLGEIGRS